MNKTLMTDFYELTMAQTYFNNGKQDEEVVFDVFFRKNPFEGGYTVSAGLDNIIDYINNFKFGTEEINYLRSLGMFSEEFLNYLSNLKFTGSMWAIPDGTVVFPNEPIITVKAKVIEAQLIETALLANFNYASLVTTSTRRIINETKGIPVMEFGARRARGIDAAIEASKYAIIGGCASTSNTYAGMKYGLPVSGTMAHSLVTESESEYKAFLNYAKSNPENTVFLVDTYDTLRSGIPNAIRVAKDYLIPNGYKFKGIRIDSGDLAYLSKQARIMLDEAGFTDTAICVSNGLNEFTIKSILEEGAKINSIGLGDNITASKERIGGVYKLVGVVKNEVVEPRIKVSEDVIKTINPGFKVPYRFYDKETGYALGDVIALYDEEIEKDGYTLINEYHPEKRKVITNYIVRKLQVPVFEEGKQVYQIPSIMERKEYSAKEMETIYPEVKRLLNPHLYYVDLSKKLLELKRELILEHKKEANEAVRN